MKKRLFFLLFGLWTLGVVAQTNPAHPERSARTTKREAATLKGAKLVMDQTTWNFGDVARKGGDLHHDFTVRNEGSAPLVILRVVTSCSCVKAHFPKRPIAVGEEGVIRITVEPLKSEPGVFNRVVRIYSNPGSGSDLVTVQGASHDVKRVQHLQGDVEDVKIKVRGDNLKIKVKE